MPIHDQNNRYDDQNRGNDEQIDARVAAMSRIRYNMIRLCQVTSELRG